MVERCELLLKAKSLAIKRGLDSSQVECPAVEICTGETCIFKGVDLENRYVEKQKPVVVNKGGEVYESSK